jgi:hypothetical protein
VHAQALDPQEAKAARYAAAKQEAKAKLSVVSAFQKAVGKRGGWPTGLAGRAVQAKRATTPQEMQQEARQAVRPSAPCVSKRSQQPQAETTTGFGSKFAALLFNLEVLAAVLLLGSLLWSLLTLTVRFLSGLLWAVCTQPPEALSTVVPIAMLRAQLDEVGNKYGVDRENIGLSSGHQTIEDIDDLVEFGSSCRLAAEGIETSGGMWHHRRSQGDMGDQTPLGQ